jgi:hypothetical protein
MPALVLNRRFAPGYNLCCVRSNFAIVLYVIGKDFLRNGETRVLGHESMVMEWCIMETEQNEHSVDGWG